MSETTDNWRTLLALTGDERAERSAALDGLDAARVALNTACDVYNAEVAAAHARLVPAGKAYDAALERVIAFCKGVAACRAEAVVEGKPQYQYDIRDLGESHAEAARELERHTASLGEVPHEPAMDEDATDLVLDLPTGDDHG